MTTDEKLDMLLLRLEVLQQRVDNLTMRDNSKWPYVGVGDPSPYSPLITWDSTDGT